MNILYNMVLETSSGSRNSVNSHLVHYGLGGLPGAVTGNSSFLAQASDGSFGFWGAVELSVSS